MKNLIKKSLLSPTLLLCTIALLITGCGKDETPEAPIAPKPFELKDHFVAGTLTPRSGSISTSVFFIQFLEDNKALFINSSANNLVGSYTLTDTELTFEVTGGNARTAKFTLDKDKKITSAYYKALTMEYDATGELLPTKETNELAGKTFKGEEFKMGQVSNRKDVIYSFSKAGTTTYGSGTDAASLNTTATSYTLIGGSGFKSINGSTTELGFVSNRKLTIFKSSGLSYYGKYDQQ